MKTLTRCTLTGIDEQTDLAMVSALSNAYPFAEWGFLYSPSRQGQSTRYPSVNFLRRAFHELPDHVNVSLHTCGAGVSNLIHGESVVTHLVELVDARFGRVQLNFDMQKSNKYFTIE